MYKLPVQTCLIQFNPNLQDLYCINHKNQYRNKYLTDGSYHRKSYWNEEIKYCKTVDWEILLANWFNYPFPHPVHHILILFTGHNTNTVNGTKSLFLYYSECFLNM